MKTSLWYAALPALVLVVILAFLFSITTPVIYSLEKDSFPSRFHNNTDSLKRQSLNSTEDILPLMQELFDYSGPIILNIRLDDPEQARRDLELLTKKRVAFSNLIVKLDMTQSEMQEYAKSRALQNKLLSELVNSSISLHELKKLEVHYRDAQNPTMLMSVQLEGEALHTRMQELSDQYENETRVTTTTGKKIGLETSQDEESVSSFRQYMKETAPTERSPVYIPPRRTNLLTFILIPAQVSYGDTISFSGYLFSPMGFQSVGVPGKNVTVYIGNEPVSVSGTDSAGGYSVQLPVERIPPGTYPVHAESGTTLSETQMLTVIWADSITTLFSGPVAKTGEVTVTGRVSAGVPVRNAPVQIIQDGMVLHGTTTDAKGQFRAVLKLPAGNHTLIARFSGNELPVHPSESKPLQINVSLPADYSAIILTGTVAITLVLFVLGALFYLRRMREGRIGYKRFFDIKEILRKPVASGEEEGFPGPVVYPPIGSPLVASTVIPGTLFSRYTRVLQENGLSEAAHEVYQEFSHRIAHDQQIKGYDSLTPGELSLSCRKKPYCGAFSRFVSLYATIRYGGLKSEIIRAEFEGVLQHTEMQLGGEDYKE